MLTFTLAGQRLQIPDLTPAMNSAFMALYAARLSNHVLPDSTFDAAAQTFLASTQDHQLHDRYFDSFTSLWTLYLNGGRFADAMGLWEYALRPVLAMEAGGAQRIHKGTAYYFWGMTALLNGNLDLGYLLMHCGVEEDVQTHSSPAPDTPGFALVTLDHERPTQAFRQWVQIQAAEVERRLVAYRFRHSRTLTLSNVRSKLLCQAGFREAAFLFSYAIARLNRLAETPFYLWRGPFPHQLAFSIVFDFCLVIEEAIKVKSGSSKTFIHQAAHLSSAAGLSLTLSELRSLNGLFLASFDHTLANAISDQLSLPQSARLLTPLECSLAATYGCRNRTAHNASPPRLDASTFDTLLTRITDTLFLTVDACY